MCSTIYSNSSSYDYGLCIIIDGFTCISISTYIILSLDSVFNEFTYTNFNGIHIDLPYYDYDNNSLTLILNGIVAVS